MTDLVTLPEGAVPTVYNADAIESVTSNASYVPRLQAMTANSGLCKSGDFPINNYALVADKEYKDVGKEVEVIVLSARSKAMDMRESVLTYFNHESESFKAIVEEANKKRDPSEGMSGCMYGPEFLLWIPHVESFATFFLSSKSSRREAKNFIDRMSNAAILKMKKIETPKFTWYAPQVIPSNTPLAVPEQSVLIEQINKFLNEEDSKVERVEEESRER